MANVIKPVKDIPRAYPWVYRRETAVLLRPNLWGTTGENIPVRSVLPRVQKNRKKTLTKGAEKLLQQSWISYVKKGILESQRI